KLDVNHEGCSDQYTIHEIMEGISHHDHHSAASLVMSMTVTVRMVMGIGFMRRMDFTLVAMAMAPKYQLLQNKKQQDSQQYGCSHRLNAAGFTESVWQNFQEYGSEHRTNGITHQHGNPG